MVRHPEARDQYMRLVTLTHFENSKVSLRLVTLTHFENSKFSDDSGEETIKARDFEPLLADSEFSQLSCHWFSLSQQKSVRLQARVSLILRHRLMQQLPRAFAVTALDQLWQQRRAIFANSSSVKYSSLVFITV
ncbi:hypothetical protein U1Q18_039515 [Sarracenia purpurea var. burkii]